jgi:hypothetical protein
MRDYGRVYSSFWTSEDTRRLTDDGRLLALYLLSGPHSTIAGVCRLPDGYVHEDLGWSIKRVREGFTELLRKGFANRCGTTDWVWICRFLAWNTPENPNQWKAARKIAASVPRNCSWKADFSRVFSLAANGNTEPLPEPYGNGSETLTEPLPTQEQDQKQDLEQKQEQKKERGKRAFDPSSVLGLNLDAWVKWFDYRAAGKWPIKPVSIQDAAEELAAFGSDQMTVVKKSVASGWRGLFAPKVANGGSSTTSSKQRKTADELEAEEVARNA